MIRIITHLILIVSLFGVHAANAEIRLPEDDKIQSKILGEERKIVIQLPRNYDGNDTHKYPVMYLLDGPGHLSHTSGSLDFLNQSGTVPEMIIVGIANTDRTRDLTPPLKNTENPAGGGADKFLDFIEKELIPYIDAKYQTENFKIITGHSFGGLLVIHSLHTRPHLFQAHFAFSPSLWWDEKSPATDTIEFLAKTPTLKNFLYMNIGNEDGAMREAFDELTNTINKTKPAKFKFRSDVYEIETHMTTPVIGQFYAYRQLFSQWALPRENFKLGAESAEKHYAKLTEHYGFEVVMAEHVLNRIGYFHLEQEKDAKTAIKILARNVEKYPNSANVYDSLADAYEADGQTVAALKQMDIAVAMLKENDPLMEMVTKHRNRLLTKQSNNDSTTMAASK